MPAERLCKKLFVAVISLGVLFFVVQLNEVTLRVKKLGPTFVNDSVGTSIKNSCNAFEAEPPDACGNHWKESYKALHKRIINKEQSPKFLVYYCGKEGGCGGYGNRLFAITSLFYLAVLTDRAFVIHWDYPKPLDTYLMPNEIQWNYSLQSLEKLEHRLHWWSNYRKSLQRKKGWLVKDDGWSIGEFFARTNFLKFFDKPVEIVAMSKDTASFMNRNLYLKKRILGSEVTPFRHRDGTERRNNLIGCGFDFLFKKAEKIGAVLEENWKEIQKPDSLTIGLHIRTGDETFGRTRTATNTSWFLKTTAVPDFFACAEKVENWLRKREGGRAIGDCKVTWFIATDNVSVKAYARKHFPHRAKTLDIKPSHIEIQADKKVLENDGMTEALLDHFALSKCDFLIISLGSTFGETAAGLSMRKKAFFTYVGKCELPGAN